MTALNLDCLAHSEGHPRRFLVDRETIYRTELDSGKPTDITFRIRIHIDRSYAFQSYAVLELLTAGSFVSWYSVQDKDRIVALEAWETEDSLVEVVARTLLPTSDVSMVHFETQGALAQGGFDSEL